MPTYCCSCSARGVCKSCQCVTAGRRCTNCVPSLHGRCHFHAKELPEPVDGGESQGTTAIADRLPSSCPPRVTASTDTTIATVRTGADPTPPANDVAVDEVHVVDALLNAARRDAGVLDWKAIYDDVVKWKKNLFTLPLGTTGKAFVQELANLIGTFVQTEERSLTWLKVTVACQLLLQKPNGVTSTTEHMDVLKDRLELWSAGEVQELWLEGQCIQAHLPSTYKSSRRAAPAANDTEFSRQLFAGKFRAAMDMLSTGHRSGVLKVGDIANPQTGATVRDVLISKHPPSVDPPDDALLDKDEDIPRSVTFSGINGKLIKQTSREISGSAGPSGMDADDWKRLLTCYGSASDKLCANLAAATRVLCKEDLGTGDVAALTAARLIPLDKQPGVRPIAVGEVHRRIMCKAVMKVAERDVRAATAPLQLCVGIPYACEAGVHSMVRLFDDPATEAVLFVDATNAFNSMNRKAALHNIPRVCPVLGKIFRNTYRDPVRLFVTGGGEVSSTEGTCQGDPLAMAFYAAAMMPLVDRLQTSCPTTTQKWYADDDAAAGKVRNLHQYWTNIEVEGPKFGYYPNATKSILLVKPGFIDEATALFAGSGVAITSEGATYLGAALGQRTFCQDFVQGKVDAWTAEVRQCSKFAETQPHASYTTLTRGLIPKWLYLARAMPECAEAFKRLDDSAQQLLLCRPRMAVWPFRSFPPTQPTPTTTRERSPSPWFA